MRCTAGHGVRGARTDAQARKSYQQVISTYKGSTAAVLAEQALRRVIK